MIVIIVREWVSTSYYSVEILTKCSYCMFLDDSTVNTCSPERTTQKAQSSGTTPSSSSSLVINDIALSTLSFHCQPVDVTFPVRYYSGKARSFNPQWFRLYPLLEYSISSDAAFCYACRLFGSTNVCSSRPERAFTLVGFRDCKHATGTKGIHINHHNSLSHKQAVVAWQQFKASLERGSVAEQLGSTRAVQIDRNVHYIKSIAEVLLLQYLTDAT